ncbi:hypothetical protein BCR33DRAFT_715363 [Rhizoclosmatium globosum]|uniref:SH3 domain-containing protein n=1 Tax=Rhizoclosmatium globosum TaxID=329046 RepID=A0A1Y2CIU9_9FUNG|nr:hypothetical protein BCR33DRAFT_715363 [Rhizoclosmatium globosum]|eukprot:ORY46973.1 hypothetical protein BCR33DRAFT_715363 [Rhizoclosmatium globosum]
MEIEGGAPEEHLDEEEHSCAFCVVIKPQSSESPYRHCLADAETRTAAGAAAAVALQLQTQQSLLMAQIDYVLVYALHSFVATLEGQVCVLKGDPLALLDDSNSYWWLVRCCKTDEIGYIPAENIETPSERIARLNRIRNVLLALVDDDDFDGVEIDGVEMSLASAGLNESDLPGVDIESTTGTSNRKSTIGSRRTFFNDTPQVHEIWFLGDYHTEEELAMMEAGIVPSVSDIDPAVDVSAEGDEEVIMAEGSASEERNARLSVADVVEYTVAQQTTQQPEVSPEVSKMLEIDPRAHSPVSMKDEDDDDNDAKSVSGKRMSFWSRITRTVTRSSRPSSRVRSSSRNSIRSRSRAGTPDSLPTIDTTKHKTSANNSASPAINTPPSTTTPPISPPTSVAAAPETIRVMRIYSGNVDLSASATFKTVSWTQETTVQQLLESALKNLSILHFDSQERRLPPTENVYNLLQTLSAKKLPGSTTSTTAMKRLQGTTTQILINDDRIIKIIVNRDVDRTRLLRVFMKVEEGKVYKTVSVVSVRKFKLVGGVDAVRFVTVGEDGTETVRETGELIHDILARDEGLDFYLQRVGDVAAGMRTRGNLASWIGCFESEWKQRCKEEGGQYDDMEKILMALAYASEGRAAV